MYGKNDSSGKTVKKIVFSFNGETCLNKVVLPITFLAGFFGKSGPFFRAVTQFEFFKYIISESPVPKVSHAYGPSLFSIELLSEKRGGIGGNCHQAFTFIFLLDLLRGKLLLLDGNIVPLCKISECFRIRELLMLHQESNHIATFPGAEIFENPLCGGHHKRGSFFIGKRTETLIVSPTLFKCYKIRDHLNYVGSIKYLVYGLLVYHSY